MEILYTEKESSCGLYTECTTLCPNGIKTNKKPVFVGSLYCGTECKFKGSQDTLKKILWCNYRPSVAESQN